MKYGKLVEIFPYGLALSPGEPRPTMLFKDKSEQRVLPVWLSPMDAGISIHQNSVDMGKSSSPYKLSWRILKTLGVYLESCTFTEVKGFHQYVELKFKGHPKIEKLESRAEEAVSFCLSNKTQFFCGEDFFNQCRVVDQEMLDAHNLLKKNNHSMQNNHPYLN